MSGLTLTKYPSNILQKGQSLVELVLTIGLSAILIPALYTGVVASREGKPQQEKRLEAAQLFKQTEEAVKNIRNSGWSNFATNGTFHPEIASARWTLVSGASTSAGFTQQVVISDTQRDNSGKIVTSGGTNDPSTKKVDITVSWTQPHNGSISSTLYLSRLDNFTSSHTTATDFSAANGATLTNTQVTNVSGGEVKLANNNKGKWCSPAFASTTIDLPDGPPVAVAATASATSINIPNDVFVATAPYASSSVKLAYLKVDANTDTPLATQEGTFTLDASKYSSGTYPSSTGGLTNDFKTNDVKYYTSSTGKLYALMATNDASHEVVVAQITSGGANAYQDATNKIYKYWTYFNTTPYNGASTNDQAPYGYGATSLSVLENRGYLTSGGYLYIFDLSNIDSKTPTSGLDIVGCRIELDGYDCNASTSRYRKYGSGDTGTTYDAEQTSNPACSDGGNTETNANNDVSPVKVGSNIYVFIANGYGTDPEMDIVNATSVPSSSSNPRINNASCGRITGGNSSWKRISSLDFNNTSNTQEAANSVYARSDGNRAYISSNGGIDANHDGQADSHQFYVINTSNKTSPSILSYYDGSGANSQMYPRRSLTVQNGVRAVLVGKDGTTDSNDAYEYQVTDMTTESAPAYCGGLNFDSGFNDLTSVSELDGDNYVYMVANTNVNELKIIQGGPDNAIYVASGTFESPTFDTNTAGLPSSVFNRWLATVDVPSQTSISAQIAVAPAVSGSCTGVNPFPFLGPDGTASTYFTASNASISAAIPFGNYLSNTYQNPGRCFRYKTSLSTLDQTQTPILYDATWNYSP
jgi:hypothetical protein